MNFEEELRRELLNTFIVEAQENLQALNDDLLRLEQGSDDADQETIIQQLFRTAHNLKGAARAVGLDVVSELAHKLESIFGAVRAHELVLTPALFDMIYRGVDGVSEQVEVAAQGGEPGDDCATLLEMLEAAAQGNVAPASGESVAIVPGDNGTTRGAPSAGITAGSPVSPDEPALANIDTQVRQDAPSPVTKADAGVPVAAATVGVQPGDSDGPKPKLRSARGPEKENDETVRLSTQKLDELMAHIGELQIARNAAEQALADLHGLFDALTRWETAIHRARSQHQWLADPDTAGGLSSSRRNLGSLQRFLVTNERYMAEVRTQVDALYRRMKSDNHRMGQIVAALQEDVRQTRLRPLSTILDPFPRMVRDLSRAVGKEVRLVIEGEDTEVDRSVVELLKPPLVHLVRNAVDHGIEAPDVRRAAGKNPTGVIRIRAAQQGDVICIEVSDDGAGIDVEKVLERAIASGLISAEQAGAMTADEAMWLIFRAGFSTRRTVSDISGRGVGLDVVWDALERIQGSVSVATELGQGSRFTLTIPLTIATVLALLLRVQDQTFAAPILSINRILHLQPKDVRWVDGAPVINHRDEPVPVVTLASLLNLPEADLSLEGPTILLHSGERRTALLVDELIGVQELVVKNLPAPLYRVRNIAGASILGDGRAVLILNAADLLQGVVQGYTTQRAIPPPPAPTEKHIPTVLVVDDSVTTRTLERTILQTAGYRVITAIDGADAWAQLQIETVDLVVSDVDMPHMSGFELTAAVRSDKRLQDLPVILVTSLDSAEDRQRGVEVGADAYIVKGAFDQQHLLETIEKFV